MRILPSKVMARPRKGNVALNLSINEELKRLFESQCALEGVEMSEVTEELYRAFLARQRRTDRIKEEAAGYNSKGKKK